MKAALFYDNNGMVSSTDLGWLQPEFDTLTGIFDWVGLRTHVHRTVGMVCRPLRAAGVKEDKAYTWRMTGRGRRFKERQGERVLRPECGKEMEKISLVTHRQTQHGVAKGGLGPEGNEADRGDKPKTYRMVFPKKEGPRPCPAEGCSGWASMGTDMRVHFWHQNVRHRGDTGLGQPTPPTVPYV